MADNFRHAEDALIALTAASRGCILVTDDRFAPASVNATSPAAHRAPAW